MTMKRVLLTDDDPEIRKMFQKYLIKKGFAVTVAKNGCEAMQYVKGRAFDLIIMDLNLPDGFGGDYCEMIRKVSTTPILVLTASESEQDYVKSLNLGADDFVTKTTALSVILAKIDAILRREEAKEKGVKAKPVQYRLAAFSGWKFFPKEKKLLNPEKVEIYLTENESALLSLLLENNNKPVSKSTIDQWLCIRSGSDSFSATEVLVSRLRKKLEVKGGKKKMIETIRNKGYKLCSKVSYE